MKKLWLDVETTGVNSEKNGIIQLACIVEGTKNKFTIDIKPFKDCIYDAKALKINGKTKKQIVTYNSEALAMRQFIFFLDNSSQDKEQFSISGYNSRFDQDFIIALFKRHKQYNFWSYFNYKDIDVFALIKILDLWGVNDEGKPSQELKAMCKEFGIKIKAHDAIEDIKATRKLYNKLVKKYLK